MDLRPRLEGLDRVRARIEKVVRAVQDPTPGFRAAIPVAEQYVRLTFATQGASSHRRRWRGLKRSTKRARKKRWGYYRRSGSGTANIWSGATLRAFLGGAKHIRRISRTQLEWGADIPAGRGSGRSWWRKTPMKLIPGHQGVAVPPPVIRTVIDHYRKSLRE